MSDFEDERLLDEIEEMLEKMPPQPPNDTPEWLSSCRRQDRRLEAFRRLRERARG